MPINISDTKVLDPRHATVAEFCYGVWDLGIQFKGLSDWLQENKDTLKPGDYRADVSFISKKMGGAFLVPAALGEMGRLGISLFLSEVVPNQAETEQ